MADYYFDISIASGGSGITADPYGWAEFITYCTGAGNLDNFYTRGQVSTGTSLLRPASGTRNYVRPWDLELYGPWRINFSGVANFVTAVGRHTELFGGIVNAASIIYLNGAKNCFLITGNVLWIQYNAPIFSGCYIKFVDFNYVTGSDGGTFKDCSFIASAADINFASRTQTVNRCAFNKVLDNAGNVTLLNENQFNWSPPATPAWDDPIASFNTDTILAGITKPQPYTGNAPYTDYETDLFGATRTSISTGAMIPVWADTYPKISFTGTINAGFTVQTNQNGNAYFVIVPDGAAAPTPAQVKAGQDGSGTPVAAGFSGSVALTANTDAALSASNLTRFTEYDVYFIAESGLLQSAVVKLDMKTEQIPLNSIVDITLPNGSSVNMVIDALRANTEVTSTSPGQVIRPFYGEDLSTDFGYEVGNPLLLHLLCNDVKVDSTANNWSFLVNVSGAFGGTGVRCQRYDVNNFNLSWSVKDWEKIPYGDVTVSLFPMTPATSVSLKCTAGLALNYIDRKSEY